MDLPLEIQEIDKIRSRDLKLPDHVSFTQCENGTKLYLIGTAHFSEKSNNDLMNNLKPDFLVLELCRSRDSILYQNAQQTVSLKEINFFELIKQLGPSQGVLHYLLLRMSMNCIKELGMLPGGEFIAAFEEAKSQVHCHIIFGDRPIAITLNRSFQSLGLIGHLRLIYSFITSLGSITKEDVENLKNMDLLDEFLKELSECHPEVAKSILHERDAYLCRSIWEACGMNIYTATQNPKNFSMQCCNEWPSSTQMPRVVLAVVGLGHINGIKREWPNADKINKKELCTTINPPLSWRIFTISVKLVTFATLLGSTYSLFKLSSRATSYFIPKIKFR